MEQDLLGSDGDLDRLLGRDRVRLVERVGVQRLDPAEDGGEGLDRDAGDVVQRLLRGQRDTGGLGMGAKQPRLRPGSRAVRGSGAPTAGGPPGAWRSPRRSRCGCRRRTRAGARRQSGSMPRSAARSR